MDVREMQAFLSLASLLHFGRASEACHMSPSALSRSIKRTEDELGAELFRRDKRSVSLTPAGKLFISYCEESLARRSALEYSLNRETAELQGELRLYCSVTASYSYLQKILPAFRLQHPGIELKLRTGDQARSIARALAGEDDIVIAAEPQKMPSRLKFQELGRSTLRFIAPTTPCVVKDLLEPELIDWESLPFIVAETGIARERLDHWFKSKGIKPYRYAQVSGHDAIVTMVGLGFGVALVPEIVINSSPLKSGVQFLEVEPNFSSFGIGICALASRMEDPLAKAFWGVAANLSAGE
jgi:LysR family positive regulator for ilvC